MADTIIEGGCFCGDVRYRATEPPCEEAGACHCKNCRHANAAPYSAGVWFGTDNLETDRFRVIKGEPIRYRYTSEMVVEEGDDPSGNLLSVMCYGRSGGSVVGVGHESLIYTKV